MLKITLLLSLFITINLFSQDLVDFKYLGDFYGNQEMYLNTAISRTRVTNNEAPYPENHKLTGFTGDISLSTVNFKKGAKRFSYNHKLVGDMFMLAREILFENANAIYRKESSGLSCGILGWAGWTWNINTPKRHSLAAGFNLNDYFLTATYVMDSSSNPGKRESIEPQGYWFTAGPKILYDFSISKHLIFEASGSYLFGYWKAISNSYATVDKSYPNPHFGQLKAEIMTSIGFFTGIDYNWLINRGELPSNTKRVDFLLGFKFML